MAFAGFEQKEIVFNTSHSVLDTWTTQQLVAVSSGGDRIKVRNLSLAGIFWVSQASEVNTQFGAVVVTLLRQHDSITSPTPDISSSGVDSNIKKMKYVAAAGQNNPVLFGFFYRAINVSPGQILHLAVNARTESGTAIVYHTNLIGTMWTSDD